MEKKLIFTTWSLGDFLMQYPFVKFILNSSYKENFIFLINENFRDLIIEDLGVENCEEKQFLFYRGKGFIGFFRNNLKLIFRLRKKSIKYSIGLMNYTSINLIVKFLLPGKKVYFKKNKLNIRNIIGYPHETYWNYIISLFNDDILPYDMYYQFDIKEYKRFSFLNYKDIEKGNYIFIHVRYMNDIYRSLNFERLEKIIKFILDNFRNYKIILFSGEDINPIFEKLKKVFSNNNYIEFLYTNSLKNLATILNSTKLCICPDSGIMHLAQYTDANILAFFASIPPEYRLKGYKGKVKYLFHYNEINKIPIKYIYNKINELI